MNKIPKEVEFIAEQLNKNKFKSYLVGGCLRDLLLKQAPKDWDIATDATPDEIQKIFPESVYENNFGTVGIKTESENESLKIVEVTTFRIEGEYKDKRHPENIKFGKKIEEDLERRDFTINAIALEIGDKKSTSNLVDPFNGLSDISKKTIRAVHNPEERFEEDALRLLRAIRFASSLGFKIEDKTRDAIKNKAHLLEHISKERIRDEFIKMIDSSEAVSGVLDLVDLGLMKFIMPELLEGIGMGQNKHHIYSVFEHNLKSLEYAVDKNFETDLRIASLLHDVGKSRTKNGDGLNSTFYGHQVVGEKMALKMLDKLRFPKKSTEKIALLIREHMFVYDPESVTLSGVRRLIKRVGEENIDDLLLLREADRIGSGVPKAQPYRLRYLKAMIDKVKMEPVSAKMLQIRGDEVMKILDIPAGPKIGGIIAILLEEIIDNPDLNKKENLEKRVIELGSLSEKELAEKRQKANKSAEEEQKRIDDEIKKKYFV
ncbi:MAG: HD domain-containing protein [Candidatus Pacebacteria bacterium]|nr:HD domain-containing protein [Candidatus Paceibacterota bacterium]